jgi:hypothetical protein
MPYITQKRWLKCFMLTKNKPESWKTAKLRLFICWIQRTYQLSSRYQCPCPLRRRRSRSSRSVCSCSCAISLSSRLLSCCCHRRRRPRLSWVFQCDYNRHCPASRSDSRRDSKPCPPDTRTTRPRRSYIANRCDKSPRHCRSRLFCIHNCTRPCKWLFIGKGDHIFSWKSTKNSLEHSVLGFVCVDFHF